jgi:SnoaL-like protein
MATRWVGMAAFLATIGACAGGFAQSAAPEGAAVSPVDRAAIEQLLSAYNQALSSCASTQYASLFTPDGTFTSDDFRGATHRRLYGKTATLSGHDKLVELVETEEFCLNPQQRAARDSARGPGAAFTSLRLEIAADGIRGVLPLGNGGRYEDVYVKAADGWKFKSRNVVMPAAGR